MKALAVVAALFALAFLLPTTASAQGGVTDEDMWSTQTFRGVTRTLPIVGFKRVGGGPGCAATGCCNIVEVTLLDQESFDVNELGGQELEYFDINETLPVKGKQRRIQFVGARVVEVVPMAVNGQKGWVLRVCYDRQVMNLGGQELG